MKFFVWLVGSVSLLILILFMMEVKKELKEELWWRNRGKE